MATIGEEIDKYKAQVKTYDAGRPNTAAPQRPPVGFQPAESAGMAMPEAKRAPVAMSAAEPKPAFTPPQVTAQMQGAVTAQMKGQTKDYAYGDNAAVLTNRVNNAPSPASFQNSVRMPVGNEVRGGNQPFVDTEGQVMAANQQAALGDVSKLPQEMKTPSAIVTSIYNKRDEAASLAANPARRMGLTGDRAMLVAAADTINRGNQRGPLPTSVATKDIGTGPLATPAAPQVQPGAADPTKSAVAGNYAAADANGQGIFTDPETGRTSIRLTGEAGSKFMQEHAGKPQGTAESMAARRKAMGEYSGMFADRTAVPAGARPGLTLSATPATGYAKTASAEKIGGLPAREEFTPQQAPQQTAAPAMTGNPLVDQRNAEAALSRRQMEVMAAERADKTLLQAPGSRDYISPTLSEPEQRASQTEIYAQRTQDMRDARDNTIAQTQARDAALGYKGLPTDEARNRAMEPYEERRTSINQRNANMAMAQAQETERATIADKDATRAAAERQDLRKDATDRYTADKNAELATSNAVIASEARSRDRAVQLEAARIKANDTDPVAVQMQKGRDAAIAAVLGGLNPEKAQDPAWLEWLNKTYPVSGAQAKVDPYAKISIPAPRG